MRVLFALPGLHKYERGAETAFIAAARELARVGDEVTLIGSGHARPAEPYHFLHAGSVSREHFAHFPSLPVLRNDTAYEELTFAPGLLSQYRPGDYDITITCSYPFTNWILRRPTLGGRRPPHVFVTENGDWPATTKGSEYRFFGCEGLLCTSPDFYERNRARWHCRLIPNGIDCSRFNPGTGAREKFGLPHDKMVVLMASALIPSKRVEAGIEAVSRIPDAHLAVAGNGPLRLAIEAAAAQMLPQRFTLLSVRSADMPELYRSADVFLHLSKRESFGNVYLEAIASGLPVVGHDSAHLRWVVGDGEFLVDTEIPDAVSAAIVAAGREDHRKIAVRVARATQYSWHEIGVHWREFIEEIVAQA